MEHTAGRTNFSFVNFMQFEQRTKYSSGKHYVPYDRCSGANRPGSNSVWYPIVNDSCMCTCMNIPDSNEYKPTLERTLDAPWRGCRRNDAAS